MPHLVALYPKKTVNKDRIAVTPIGRRGRMRLHPHTDLPKNSQDFFIRIDPQEQAVPASLAEFVDEHLIGLIRICSCANRCVIGSMISVNDSPVIDWDAQTLSVSVLGRLDVVVGASLICYLGGKKGDFRGESVTKLSGMRRIGGEAVYRPGAFV